MCIDGFHHVPYLTAFLSNEDDAGVFEALAFDEREEVVVERQENPVVLTAYVSWSRSGSPSVPSSLAV